MLLILTAHSILSNEKTNRTSFSIDPEPTARDGLCRQGDEADDTQYDGEELSEIQEIFKSIAETINSLFRFSIIIRDNTNRDRYALASAAALRNPFDDKFDINHVSEKFPILQGNGKGWLIERLGQAITQRRQYLRYCREHHHKTSRESEPEVRYAPDNVNLLLPPKSAPTLSGASALSKPASTLAPTQASTLILNAVQNVEEDLPEETQSQTSYASSTEEDSSSGTLHIIKLEEVSKGLKHFECPYCWRIQVITTQRAWK